MNANRQWARIVSATSLLLFLAMPAMAGKFRRSPNAVRDEYIVVLDDRTLPNQVPAIAEGLARQHGASVKKVWGYAIKGFFATMTEARAEAMSRHPDVAYVEENAELFLSTTAPTKIDPSCTGLNCTTVDNRLWHLDMMDQNAAVGTGEYRYWTTGSGVYVYVVDTGVMRAHREFGNDPDRVVTGYDASGDPSWFPAWDPFHGPANDEMRYVQGVHGASHGTGVASLVAGQNVGIARNAKIVPVKIAGTGWAAARSMRRDGSYALDEIVYANSAYYRVVTAGTASGNPPGFWCSSDSPPECVTTWGSVQVKFYARNLPGSTVQMLIDGLDWIVRPSLPDENGSFPVGGPGSPYPKSPAVVTLSTYRIVGGDSASDFASFEQAITNLLNYGGGGITVIASANNQGANACDTSPARMSVGSAGSARVITAGGTMLRNNPDPNPADGGARVAQQEPLFDRTKPTRFARWRCHAGDSDECSGDLEGATPPVIPDPQTNPNGYAGTTLGSNGGACVTLFAPAKNIPVASVAGTSSYRNSRTRGGWASGTSWSAPIVAGMAARILENNPTYTALQVRNAVMAHTRADLDTLHLDPPNVTGTPNAVLQLTDVSVNDLPPTTPAGTNGPTSITVTASGTGTLQYELFQVDPAFDVNVSRRNAAASTRVAGPQASSTFSVTPAVDTSYFVRVISNCGSADTSITTVIVSTPPAAPANFVATRSGSSVFFSWSTVSQADGYRVEQKLPGVDWTTTVTVNGGSTSNASTPAPSTSGGVVLYRVLATRNSAISSPSNADVAWVGTFEDDPVSPASTIVRGAHLVQMRRAVNALCNAAGIAPLFNAAETADEALTGGLLDDAHFADLLSRLNAARTHPVIGTPPVAFSMSMTEDRLVLVSDIVDLRNGVK